MLSVSIALISVVGAIVVAAATYFFTKRRERESEWRKFKLEHYREYIQALSGIMELRSTAEAQMRYADALNSLMLVAPPSVLTALESYIKLISKRGENKRDTAQHNALHNELLSALFREMRRDVQPRLPNDGDFVFSLLDVPRI